MTFDDVAYGGRAADDADVEEARDGWRQVAKPMSSAPARVGDRVLALVAFIVLIGCSCASGRPGGSAPSSYATPPVGPPLRRAAPTRRAPVRRLRTSLADDRRRRAGGDRARPRRDGARGGDGARRRSCGRADVSSRADPAMPAGSKRGSPRAPRARRLRSTGTALPVTETTGVEVVRAREGACTRSAGTCPRSGRRTRAPSRRAPGEGRVALLADAAPLQNRGSTQPTTRRSASR